MKLIGKNTFEHRGVKFRPSEEFVFSVLACHGIDVLRVVPIHIDRMLNSEGLENGDFWVGSSFLTPNAPDKDQSGMTIKVYRIEAPTEG